jgi:hypothetical protein
MVRIRRIQLQLLMLSSALSIAPLAIGADVGHSCAAVDPDPQRLACYDAAFGRPARAGSASAPAAPTAPVSAPAAATVAPATAAPVAVAPVAAAPVAAAPVAAAPAAAPAAAAAAPAVEPEAAFGFNEAQKRERVPETVQAQPEKRSSIESTLTLLSSRRTGEFVYTLANGQIWTQSEAEQSGYVRDGSPVTIKRAALGSFLLVSGSVSTRVRRVQ